METNYVSRDTYGIYKNSKLGGPGPYLMGADTLLGNDVYNSSDEKLGTIKEFMIEMDSGRIGYAVLSFGGFMGMGDRLFAVPWRALTLDTAAHRFLLNVDKDTLKDAPGFDKITGLQWRIRAGRSGSISSTVRRFTTNRQSSRRRRGRVRAPAARLTRRQTYPRQSVGLLLHGLGCGGAASNVEFRRLAITHPSMHQNSNPQSSFDDTLRSKAPLPPKPLIGFSLAVVAVLVIALLSYQSLRATAAASKSLADTLEVLAQLNAVMSTLKDAETGQRGYLLTGSESYLEPYTEAKAALGGELEALRGLLAGRPEQKKRLDILESLAAQKMSELGRTVDARHDGQAEAALALVRTAEASC